ncbi:HNH endonuclease [Nitrosococcus oceani]|uniref:HNH endonuclease n=1 Tax=Nitrosococcus oceani TaxID=1229 RepID=UPI0018CF4CC2|nr:HNH endonuclease [Nitrosococcus oceani]
MEASEGVHLSNGGIVHDHCYELIKKRHQSIQEEISAQKDRLRRFKNELARREGIGFKLLSIFSKPEVETSKIESSILIIESNISKLLSNHVLLREKVTPIYDYFLTYPPDWEERREKVAHRDGEHCSRCKIWSRLHLHHIRPLSKGGPNKIENLKLLCENCHSREHGGRDFSGEFVSSETAFYKRVSNIRYAIENNRKIKFGYKKPSDRGYKQRIVIPTKLTNVEHHRNPGSTLCVRGYCELRQAERIFALKRMRGLKVIQA